MIAFVCLDAFIAAVAWPMMVRKVPPNRIYGFRTPATLANDRVWYAANAASGRYLFVAAAGAALLHLLIAAKLSGATALYAAQGVFLTAVLGAALASFVALRRIQAG